MRVRVTGSKMLLIGSLLAISLPLTARTASAATTKSTHPAAATHTAHSASRQASATQGHGARAIPVTRGGLVAYRMASLHSLARRGHVYARWGGISCVPYARSVSGIEVAGNAWQWWDNAVGLYARGNRPESGSVLSFSANGRMRMGHVAVVSSVINPREIEVDQANWWGAGMSGGVSHGVPVVDVSENNDWTAVRVGLGRSGEFGSVYPTNGFIYNRPDTGTMVAAVSAPAPKPVLNPAPADLRPWAQRADYSQGFEEVAEAPPVVHAARRHTVARHTHLAAQH
jgi:surface antigen